MIIHSSLQLFRRKKLTTKTVKPSPLNNRGVRSTPGKETCTKPTLKESPSCVEGALFQSAVC